MIKSRKALLWIGKVLIMLGLLFLLGFIVIIQLLAFLVGSVALFGVGGLRMGVEWLQLKEEATKAKLNDLVE